LWHVGGMEKTASGTQASSERRRWPRAVWIKRVRDFRDSGLSAEEYAARKSVELRTLKSWLRVLRKEGEALPRRDPPAFLPVNVLPVRKPPATAAAVMVEVDLANGRRVRMHIRPDTNVRQVADLLDAVEGGQRC
jgi:transposase-like protein